MVICTGVGVRDTSASQKKNWDEWNGSTGPVASATDSQPLILQTKSVGSFFQIYSVKYTTLVQFIKYDFETAVKL